MRRLLCCAILLVLTASVSLAQGNDKNIFGPRYVDCQYSSFKSLYASLNGRDSVFEMKVPAIFRNKFRKELIKTANAENKEDAAIIKNMADGMKDIYFLTYSSCPVSFRDSIDNAMISHIRPYPDDYCRDSCYVYGYHSNADTLNLILMHIASKSTIIYMTGVFPCKID